MEAFKDASLAILFFSPKLVTGYVWQIFVVNVPPHCIIRLINYLENPFLSQKALRDIAVMQERSGDVRTRLWWRAAWEQ